VRILVLGGTVFLGRHVVAAALARGHDVTLFNRGRQNRTFSLRLRSYAATATAPFPRLMGDLSALNGRSFDAVIDPSGSRPEPLPLPRCRELGG
jgi:2'-hydroxyisoflavone reductase